MNGYKAFYRDRTCEVQARTSYEAQTKAAKIFRALKQYGVNVILCEKDGVQVSNSTTEL